LAPFHIVGFITPKKEMIKAPTAKGNDSLDDNQRVEIEAISDLIKAEVNVKRKSYFG
jgi:hypothetical protein